MCLCPTLIIKALPFSYLGLAVGWLRPPSSLFSTLATAFLELNPLASQQVWSDTLPVACAGMSV